MTVFSRRDIAKLLGLASAWPLLGGGGKAEAKKSSAYDDTPMLYWLSYERMLEGNLDLVHTPITCALLNQNYEYSAAHSLWAEVRQHECEDSDYRPVALNGKVLARDRFFADDVVYGTWEDDDPVSIRAAWLVAVETPCLRPFPGDAPLVFACHIAARAPEEFVESTNGSFRVEWHPSGVFSWDDFDWSGE